jgi:hypothetical protein
MDQIPFKEIFGISILTLSIFALINYSEFKEMFLTYWNKDKKSKNDYFSNLLNGEEKKKEVPKEEKVAGVGSIWNNNNWFYEEKNYSSFAKTYLKEQLSKIDYTSPQQVCVRFTEVLAIEGEASITIRK